MTKSHSLSTGWYRGFWRLLMPRSAELYQETNAHLPFHTMLE